MIAGAGLARSASRGSHRATTHPESEKIGVWQMHEGTFQGIIPCMRRWRGSMLRHHLWVVAAVLAVLIAGLAADDQSASATSYDPEELRFLQLINDYRESNGLGNLLLSDTLSVSSERHSQ